MKNILLITIDCLRYDHSDIVVKKISEIIGDGLVFESAYATGPATKFSFPGILSSKWTISPDEKIFAKRHINKNGKTEEKENLGKRTTIFSIVKKAGYKTIYVPNSPVILKSSITESIDIVAPLKPATRWVKSSISERLRGTNNTVYRLGRMIYRETNKIIKKMALLQL
jgi:arylsulfatase A-like enzyme